MNGGAWVASYVMLWVTVVVMAVAIVALLRQIGVLHARLQPLGAHFAGEGPERLAPAPFPDVFDYGSSRLTLVAFTSVGCQVCASLSPGIRALDRQFDDLAVHVVVHDPGTAPTFAAFNVTSTPYFVTADRQGIVRVRGIANSLEQIEEMIEESLAAEASLG
jgi:hypothetical protein